MPEEGPVADERLRLHLLVLGAQAGDERAFGRLFERFSRRTLGYLRNLVGDDAEDVQQEVWLSVYRNLRGLANPGAFRTWLFQVTRHRAMDLVRRRTRERRVVEEMAGGADEAGGAGGDEGEIDVTEVDLGAIAGKLSPVLGEVLVLRYGNDLSLAEIALVTGCAVGTVKSRLFEARRRAGEIIGNAR